MKKNKILDVLHIVWSIITAITIGVGCGALVFFASLINDQVGIIALIMVCIELCYVIYSVVK